MTVGEVIDRHSLIVCVGTGGVGKTTVAAATAVGAAIRGRRAMVITIDPAHQLARALGLTSLGRNDQRVPNAVWEAADLHPRGSLSAAMLDQKGAWDSFICRHAPSTSVRDAILSNPFYQELSSSFSGATEYVAIEELCRLSESGEYDLIVLDTPPAGSAIEFLQAPGRIDKVLDPEVSHWLTRPYATLGRGVWRAASLGARYVLGRLEHATSAGTLREVSAFFIALEGLFDEITRRSERARALLRADTTAFVLVTGPKEDTHAETEALIESMHEHRVRLGATVVNRVHPVPGGSDLPEPILHAVLSEIPDVQVAGWLRRTYELARAIANAERRRIEALDQAMPSAIARATIPELRHDADPFGNLVAIADELWRESSERLLDRSAER